MHCDDFVYLCGDFNSRVGELEDHIAGVDLLPPRHVVDSQVNSHGDLFCDFLVNGNLCILNGRNYISNDFTSISSRGAAVVDYCLVPYEQLDKFQNFQVTRSSELVNRAGCTQLLESSSKIPDHSLLQWTIQLDIALERCDTKSTSIPGHRVKFNTDSVSADFLSDDDILLNLAVVISELENSVATQHDLDKAYSEFCGIVKTDMYQKLEHKVVLPGNNTNRKRRLRKPWWNDNLTRLWNEVCQAESNWLKAPCRSSIRKNLKVEFIHKRKAFHRSVQQSKRKFWQKQQDYIMSIHRNNKKEFWREIGKIGIGDERVKSIPFEIVMPDGSVCNDHSVVMNRWKSDFESLLNKQEVDLNDQTGEHRCDNESTDNDLDLPMCDTIEKHEVYDAIVKASVGKAMGIDEIPIEVLKNDTALEFLHKLFNICFDSGRIPTLWSRGIIHPIPKNSTVDNRNPLCYRGITLASAAYKLYCGVLNNRLSNWAEDNNKIVDEQNGFRKGRSTIDHISTLTNIIEIRKQRRLSTFVAFIDFRKAYDNISRNKLWIKLKALGIKGKMLGAITSIYRNVESCVRVNGFCTDWFTVKCGLKQGCLLSPVLFNLYINDLADKVRALGSGVSVLEGETVSILLYADDIVLLAENEADLQRQLDILAEWCGENSMSVNGEKSNIMHFRSPSMPATKVSFECGDVHMKLTDKYIYLGLLLTEYLDYNEMAKVVAKSASRALGLVISKSKQRGGMPFEPFKQLFDSMVWPIIEYGAGIWGTADRSGIEAVQLRACRYFRGVGRYTPNAAVNGEMGWKPVKLKQWASVCRLWCRLVSMPSERINKRVFMWANLCAGNNSKTCSTCAPPT